MVFLSGMVEMSSFPLFFFKGMKDASEEEGIYFLGKVTYNQDGLPHADFRAGGMLWNSRGEENILVLCGKFMVFAISAKVLVLGARLCVHPKYTFQMLAPLELLLSTHKYCSPAWAPHRPLGKLINMTSIH